MKVIVFLEMDGYIGSVFSPILRDLGCVSVDHSGWPDAS